jgi:hypothetical protein
MWVSDISILPEVHSKIRSYTKGEIDLSELERWFYNNIGELLSLPPSLELYLAGEIQLGLAELTNDDIVEDEFKKNLEDLLNPGDILFFGSPNATYEIIAGTVSSTPIIFGSLPYDLKCIAV